MADESDVDSTPVDSGDADAGAQGGAPGEAAPPSIDFSKVKAKIVVDGQEEEHDFESLKRLAQLGKAGHKRLQQASELTKAAKAMEEQFGKDPVATMVAKFGPEKTKEMLETKLYEMYKRAQETPEQKEAREAKEELTRLKDEKAQLAKEKEEARARHLEEQFAQKFNRDFTEAIKSVGLPHTAHNVQRMAELGALALDNDLDVDAVEIAKMVKDERRNTAVKTVQDMTAEELVEVLGEKLNDVRKLNISKLKSPAMSRRPNTAPAPRKGSVRTESELTPEERFERYKASLKD